MTDDAGAFDAWWGWPPPVLDPAGPYADSVTVLAWALFAMGVVVTLVVVAALYVALAGPARWKARLGGERSIWILGIAFPGVVLIGLLVWGLTLTASLTDAITGDEPRIRVTGHMWWFDVEYLDRQGRVVLRDANELHLPVGQPVVLELRSADVIHSFWVPNLSGKEDMVPGRTNLLKVQADRVGRFGGVCAEYCGGPHALMGFVTVAHGADDYRRWLTGERVATAPADPQAVPGVMPSATRRTPASATVTGLNGLNGQQVFMDSGCAACHRVEGTGANGMSGPDLTHVARRLSLGAGVLPNNRGTLIGWIADSQSIKPGNRMPTYNMLSADELEAIAIWLEQPR
ncbi:c-type cytochrome [Altererythrobacter aerius]|uniref:C-type cytochrome n=1 Tax=Tsuneonella aeria TaxID=1837929 RepID=A0A6I4TFG4_9SPHN|nr:cytochrome c oxidase subunit II [Tsuneonella aeria]MXO76022.1 c-type cytochrome [Tsuneonella aeria]